VKNFFDPLIPTPHYPPLTAAHTHTHTHTHHTHTHLSHTLTIPREIFTTPATGIGAFGSKEVKEPLDSVSLIIQYGKSAGEFSL